MNPAESFQDEIKEIFDDFLELMKFSRPKVVVESQRYFGFCVVGVTLFKCRSCVKPLIEATIRVSSNNDVLHLAKFLDGIINLWKNNTPSDTQTDTDTESDF